jgi:Putative bacterial sensory transduction regulator
VPEHDPDELAARERAAHELLATHLEGAVAAEAWIQTVEYDPELRRWYVRFGCEGRDATTIYFDLHQRTLRYEVYFLPDPPAHDAVSNNLDLYRYLLQRNHDLYGARFSIGPDGDVYLTGRVALEHLTVEELDRVIGVLYEIVERTFPATIRIAYPSAAARRATPGDGTRAGEHDPSQP